MASPVRTLLKKKKLTGEELGKILLIDLADAYANRPNLSREEQNKLPEYIDNPRDGKIFNEYVAIHRYLMAMSIDYEAEVKRLNLNYLNLLYRMQLVEGAETTYFSLTRQPIIMTRKDYEKHLRIAKRQLEQYTYSFFDMVAEEVHSFIPLYEAGELTPYNDIFKQLEKQPITPEMTERYLSLEYDEDKLESLNKLSYLRDYRSVYHPMETDDPSSPLQLKADYPELTKAVIAKYSKLKGLKRLAKMTEADYTRKDLIDFKTAYSLDLFGIKAEYDDPEITLDERTINGVAVIEKISKHKFFSTGEIIDDTYYYLLPPLIEVMLSENVLEDENFINHIEELHKAMKFSFKRLSGFRYALDKIVEVTGVKQIEELAQEDKSELIDNINEQAKSFDRSIWRFGLLKNEGEPLQLRKRITSLFTLNFTKEDIQIQPHEMEKVEEIISSGKSKNELVTELTNFLTRLEA